MRTGEEYISSDQVDELLLVTMEQEREDDEVEFGESAGASEDASGAVSAERGGVEDRSERVQEGRERLGTVSGVCDEPSDPAATG